MDAAFDLEPVWNRLASVNSMEFKASSDTNSGWQGEGQGSVLIEILDPDVTVFHEAGRWKSEAQKEFAFKNVYRWMALREEGALRLEHLRFGLEHPVFLFDLEPIDEVTWRSKEPHVCRQDLYAAIMTLGEEHLTLQWTVNGPTMNENLRYVYR